MMFVVAGSVLGEQLALFGPPVRLWRGRPHPRSLAADEDHEGGAFRYDGSPDLFFGRTGIGPLRVGVDTSVLIDYGEHGEAIWAEEPFDPATTDTDYRQELLALAQLMELWIMRDIRLHVFDRQLTDYRRRMTGDRAAVRYRQVVQLQSALRCLEHDTLDIQPGPDDDWPPRPDVSSLPQGADQELVCLAVEAGCHVFLTRDKRLLQSTAAVEPYWLAMLSPSGLIDAFSRTGELGLATVGEFLLPDNHKIEHGLAACGWVGRTMGSGA